MLPPWSFHVHILFIWISATTFNMHIFCPLKVADIISMYHSFGQFAFDLVPNLFWLLLMGDVKDMEAFPYFHDTIITSSFLWYFFPPDYDSVINIHLFFFCQPHALLNYVAYSLVIILMTLCRQLKSRTTYLNFLGLCGQIMR